MECVYKRYMEFGVCTGVCVLRGVWGCIGRQCTMCSMECVWCVCVCMYASSNVYSNSPPSPPIQSPHCVCFPWKAAPGGAGRIDAFPAKGGGRGGGGGGGRGGRGGDNTAEEREEKDEGKGDEW